MRHFFDFSCSMHHAFLDHTSLGWQNGAKCSSSQPLKTEAMARVDSHTLVTGPFSERDAAAPDASVNLFPKPVFELPSLCLACIRGKLKLNLTDTNPAWKAPLMGQHLDKWNDIRWPRILEFIHIENTVNFSWICPRGQIALVLWAGVLLCVVS